ncbi:hypothetical protein AAG747_13025 [Rapidithrix thailandica]|uniref:Uncharacterized protein n=1 Tax=Rapidithrix thailandica TaxID=413964 RepID=A0AAW9RYJ2_9BACT
MGNFSDIIIADVHEGEKIGEAETPSEKWPTLEARNLDSITLSTLYCSITNKKYSNEIQSSFQLAGGDQYEGPWVFLIPELVMNSYAELDTSKIKEIAQVWVATDEMQLWELPEAMELIAQLKEHACKAKEARKAMFLWYML